MNRKRSKIIILIIILLIVVLICTMYIIDRNRMKNNKPVVFSTWGYDYAPPLVETVTKYKPLEELTLEDFYLTNLMKSKYYIVMEDNIVYYKDEADKFIENVNLNIPDKLRIIQITSDLEITIKEIEFTKGKFIIRTDNRWDVDLEKESRKIFTNEYKTKKYKLVKENIKSKDNNVKTHYDIKLVSNNNSDSVYVCDYLEIKVKDEEKFKLEFTEDLTKGKVLILSKAETSKYDYDIYSYNGTVDIIIDNQKMTLREALLTNKITAEEILKKAKKDANEYKTIYTDTVQDGGSKEYIYNDYTIIKLNAMLIPRLDQDNKLIQDYNKDLYIGNPGMEISGDIK